MQCRISNELSLPDWDSFLTSCSESSIFHTPQMMEVFRHTQGHSPQLMAARNGDGSPRSLVLAVRIQTLCRWKSQFNTREVLYGGVLHQPGPDAAQAVRQLMSGYCEKNLQHSLFIEIRNEVDTTAVHPALLDSGFTFEPYLNYVIDLAPSEAQLFQNVSRTHRQCIRKAERAGVGVEEIGRENISDFQRLIELTYSRVRMPHPHVSLFEAAVDILVPENRASFLLARKQSHFIGALALLFHRSRAYAWYLGSDDDFFNCYPNHFLIWEAIKRARNRGCRIFDFVGAGRPDEPYGVRTFKSRFGGQLQNYGRYYKINSPLAYALSRCLFKWYRKVL